MAANCGIESSTNIAQKYNLYNEQKENNKRDYRKCGDMSSDDIFSFLQVLLTE